MRCTKCNSDNIENIDGYHFRCRVCGHFFDRAEIEINEKPQMPNDWLKE